MKITLKVNWRCFVHLVLVFFLGFQLIVGSTAKKKRIIMFGFDIFTFSVIVPNLVLIWFANIKKIYNLNSSSINIHCMIHDLVSIWKIIHIFNLYYRNVHLKLLQLSTYQVTLKKTQHTDTVPILLNFTGLFWMWIIFFFSSAGPQCHVNFCQHLASLVV